MLLTSHEQWQQHSQVQPKPEPYGNSMPNFGINQHFGNQYRGSGTRRFQDQYPRQFQRPRSAPIFKAQKQAPVMSAEQRKDWPKPQRVPKPSLRPNSAHPGVKGIPSVQKNKYTSNDEEQKHSSVIKPIYKTDKVTLHSWDAIPKQDEINRQIHQQRFEQKFRKTDMRLSNKMTFPERTQSIQGGRATTFAPYGNTVHIADTAPPKPSIGHPINAASNLKFGAETTKQKKLRKTFLQDRHYAHVKVQNPLYQTANHVYGQRAPNELENQEEYYGLQCKFSDGFPQPAWRNNSFVTSTSRPYVVQTF